MQFVPFIFIAFQPASQPIYVVPSFFIISWFSLFMCVLIAQSYFWYNMAIVSLFLSFSLSLQKAFMNFYYPYNPSERDTHTHTYWSILRLTVYWKFGAAVDAWTALLPFYMHCVTIENIPLLIFWWLWTDFDGQFYFHKHIFIVIFHVAVWAITHS